MTDSHCSNPHRRATRPAIGLAWLSAGLLILGLNACSNEALYQSIRLNGLHSCEELPIVQQANCKAQYQKDYRTYKRERDALDAS